MPVNQHGPGPWPTAATRLFGVIGWPVAHSRSPQLHNAAFAALGVDAVYLALAVPPDGLDAAIGGLGALGAVGVNVTVPHKQSVVASCDHLTEEARLIGAVNTLHWTDDGLVGDNTDARGLVASLGDAELAGRRVLVVGAGGAARAAVVGLARAGASLEVAARRPGPARELVELAGQAGAVDGRAGQLHGEELAAAVRRADIVVNATPLGLAGERLPTPLHDLQAHQVAVDLVYGDGPTPWLRDAASAGATPIDGWGMLVHQAALACQRWTGLDALDAMWAAAR